ncbi:MAG: T9SS type A sorting domain-containing protein, partial [Chitinophagales bacterium]
NYSDLSFGIFDDFDIGAYDDDYVGCDSALNFFYGYNGDLVDGPTTPNYGAHTPALGCIFLNSPLKHFVHFYNDYSVVGNPVTTEGYDNYMHSLWLDGTPITYGGTGYGGVTPVDFMYSGDPAVPFSWSEEDVDNPPADRKGLGTTGPFILNAGDSLCIDLAFNFSYNYTPVYDNVFAVTQLKTRMSYLQALYDMNFPDCSILYLRNEGFEGVEQQMFTGANIYPNPAMHSITITSGTSFMIENIDLINCMGEVVGSISSISENIIEVDITGLPEGCYFVKIHGKNGLSSISKFIKQ